MQEGNNNIGTAQNKEKNERVPLYGILTINYAYDEGKLTFKEWMKLSREWSLKMIEQYRSK